MNPRTVLGVLGGALLILGAFTPALSLSIFGSISYYTYSPAAGIVVIVAGALAVLLAVTGMERFLWAPGLVALAIVAAGFVSVQQRVGGARDDLLRSFGTLPGGNEVSSVLGNFVGAAVQLGWGWAVLFLGALAVLLGAFVSARFAPARA
ncbi:MAG TPA: hypothetical protein VHN99_08110 [Deinococcales bacterium]|nr:hypothetical protein [Deinococcales bacterium]